MQKSKSQLGKLSKRKGYMGEREVCHILNINGIESVRIPLSGAVKDFDGDIKIKTGGEEKLIEVKRRKKGFTSLYSFLEQEGCNYAFVRDDKKEWLVVMSIDEFLYLAKR